MSSTSNACILEVDKRTVSGWDTVTLATKYSLEAKSSQ